MTPNSLRNSKILLVDDESDIVAVLKAGLQNAGYKVDAYTDPRLALESYKPNYYERLVFDIRMPYMNGFDLARRIWAEDKDAKVCFLSAFDIHEAEARKVLRELNSYCFVTKPILPSDLAKHLENHAMQ